MSLTHTHGNVRKVSQHNAATCPPRRYISCVIVMAGFLTYPNAATPSQNIDSNGSVTCLSI